MYKLIQKTSERFAREETGSRRKMRGIWSAGVWEDGDVRYKEHPLR